MVQSTTAFNIYALTDLRDKETIYKQVRDANAPQLLDYKSSINKILQDLIDNWQSPIAYLKSRGYFPKNMEDIELKLDKTAANAQKVNRENIMHKHKTVDWPKRNRKRDNNISAIQTRVERDSKKSSGGIIGNIKGVFKKLFTKDRDTLILSNLKLDEIKLNAKKEATKYYDDAVQNLRRINDAAAAATTERDSVIQSLMPLKIPKFLKWDATEKKLKETSSDAKDDYLNGLVKIFAYRSNHGLEGTVAAEVDSDNKRKEN